MAKVLFQASILRRAVGVRNALQGEIVEGDTMTTCRDRHDQARNRGMQSMCKKMVLVRLALWSAQMLWVEGLAPMLYHYIFYVVNVLQIRSVSREKKKRGDIADG